jgi:hypothetical protein
LERLEISLAALGSAKNGTTASGSNSTAGDLGFGLRMPLIDDADYHLNQNFVDSISNASGADAKKKIYNEWVSSHWNSTSLGMGTAINLTSTTNEYSKLKWDGGQGWLTATEGVAKTDTKSWLNSWEFLEQATYRFHQLVVTKGIQSHQNVENLGAQIRYLDSWWDGYIQGAEKWTHDSITGNSSKPVLDIGIDVKLSWLDGTWLQLGWSSNNSLGGSSVFGTSLHYAFGKPPGQ